MPHDLGPQYPNDRVDISGFLKAARLHQSRFRAEKLRLPFQDYGNYLTEADARAGKNFYSALGVFAAARKRYPAFSDKVYANILRSEHIPLNLFHPLNTDDVYRLKVFSDLLDKPLRSISTIQIEYAPAPAANYLSDLSSFDAYAEYTSDTGPGLIGIEVKYTERAYPLKLGSKQHREVNNPASRYFKVMSASGIYKPNSEPAMITDEYRQIWRNQLLGESILQNHPDRFAYATLITVFPSGNQHMTHACAGYARFLTHPKQKFIALTYEHFIDLCRQHVPSSQYADWLDYLQERYLVKADE